jgi:hypothetical protein
MTRAQHHALRTSFQVWQGRARVLVPALALLLGAACCTDGEVRKDQVPRRPPPTFRLLVLTDLGGTLEPCGCTSRPLGGIDRMAAAVAEARANGVPVLFVSAGDLYFGLAHQHGDGGVPTQERWKAEALARILTDMGLQAAALGPQDVLKGGDQLSGLLSESGFAVVAPGLTLGPAAEAPEGDRAAELDEGAEVPPASAQPLPAVSMHEVAGLKIGVVGVLAPDLAAKAHPAFEGLAAPMDAARQGLEEGRAAGAELSVVLASGDRRLARELADGLDADFVVQGGLEEDEPVAPIDAGKSLLLHAARHGRGLLVVDVWHRGEGPWTDVGELRRQREVQRLEKSLEELRARIAAWEKDRSVDGADLSAQKARLRAMETDLQRAARPREVPEGKNAVAARYVELPVEAPRDAKITRRMEAFFRKVNEHNRRAYASLAPEPVPEGEAGYVGSEACGSCHAPAYEWWKRTPHGLAYGTLVKRHKEFNLDCVGCHVTGYGKPGGATVTHVETLKNVGCESCHGPGSVHVDTDGASMEHMRTDVPERVCVTCHNEEHSDLFHYPTYRKMLIVPGHGMKP